MNRDLGRFVGLWALLAGVELLERVAYAAGVRDAAGAADTILRGLEDEDLAAADVSDVAEGHSCPACCGLPA